MKLPKIKIFPVEGIEENTSYNNEKTMPSNRKVSIISHENMTLENKRLRKISQKSNQSQKLRKKSSVGQHEFYKNQELSTSQTIMENNDHQAIVTPPETKKTNNLHVYGYDNPVFEPNKNRKISSCDHTEVGPVRKKSILVNSPHNIYPDMMKDSGKHVNGDTHIKKHSVTESLHSRTRFSDIGEDEEKSWWYNFCIKCRSEEPHTSWQPGVWGSMCPYPFCPTYRQFSRVIALSLIGILSYFILYAIVGETAAPGGKLFQLIILSIGAHFGGWLITLTTLPALIGMLLMGIAFQNLGIVNIDGSFSHITKELRNIALVNILIRAGLDMDPHAFKRLKFTILKIGLIPWCAEVLADAALAKYFLDMPWSWAFMLSVIVAAVSPAVVVPCLFRLRSKGYGVAKGIPTLIIAVAGICDALSVALQGIVKSIMFSDDPLTLQILQGPISVVGGLGFGVIWGLICRYIPEKHDPFMIPLRVLLLGVGGMIAVFGSELIGVSGAGPLGCVGAAFMCIYFWSNQGWEIEDNPAATAFEIFWMIFEPILFGVTGAQIKFDELDGNMVSIGVGVIVAGALLRIAVTLVVGIGCKLNLKEKIFTALAIMSKATVQAALGPIALSIVAETHSEDSPEYGYAKKVLMVCILSIILTAPTGAILMTLGGPKLLTKTKFPVVQEGWRRSHRPSIRDISIIDEEVERGDVETSHETYVSDTEKDKQETT